MSWLLEFTVTVPGGFPRGTEDRIDRELDRLGIVHQATEVNAGPTLYLAFVATGPEREDAVAWGAAIVTDALGEDLLAAGARVVATETTPA